MQHPLMNLSLTPYRFVFPLFQKRLDFVPTVASGVNREPIIMGLWEVHNRIKNKNPLPAEVIIHDILPSQAKVNKITESNFSCRGLPYLSRDILVLSTVVQWLATNCGECFIETDISDKVGYHPEREFLLKLADEENCRDMATFWIHVCDKRCNLQTQHHSLSDPHHYDFDSVSLRDRAVIDGLMRWLGKPEGRRFIQKYTIARDKKYKAKRPLVKVAEAA